MLELQNISKVYRTADIETTALREINLKVTEGEFVGIMGPSGCGKSTLLNILGTLDTPSDGQYSIQGETLVGRTEKALAAFRRKHIGFIFQSFNLVDNLTVQENVELALLYRRVKPKIRREKVGKVLERVGMSHRARHRPSQLSGGQQQRVAIARALVSEPTIILADEPTGNLDSHHGREVLDTLCSLNDEGVTVIMVTHSTQHADAATRLVSLRDGAIVADESRRRRLAS